MSISFNPIGGETGAGLSECGECGAVVIDVKRYIHVAWHEKQDQDLQRLWDHIGNMPGGI